MNYLKPPKDHYEDRIRHLKEMEITLKQIENIIREDREDFALLFLINLAKKMEKTIEEIKKELKD